MSGRGWGGSVATAVGVAGGAGAAQLGLGYGLGIVVWRSGGDPAGDNSWLASLAWTVWIAASATVLGALIADRASRGLPGMAPPRRVAPTGQEAGRYGSVPPGPLHTLAWRLALPVAASFGALITLPLVAIPARDLPRSGTYTPATTAAGYALVGVVIGVVVAIGVLACRAAAANVVATGGWLWVLALAAVIGNEVDGTAGGTAPLATWRFTDGGWSIHGSLYVWDVLLMLGSAVVIGAAAAWRAAGRDDNRVGVALSGVSGPLLIAVAYFLAAPSISAGYFVTTPRLLDPIPEPQLSAYLVAPYAIIAGLAGSALTAFVVHRAAGLIRERRHWRGRSADDTDPAPGSASGEPAGGSGPAPGTASGRAGIHGPHRDPADAGAQESRADRPDPRPGAPRPRNKRSGTGSPRA